MAQIISALDGSSIKHCLFIDLTVNGTVYRISNAYAPLTWQGNTYTQLGNFLGISEIQDDLKATNNQISVSLSGIPPDDGSPNYMNIVLNSAVKGSRIQIYRAFFDVNSGYFNPNQVYQRFNGYVSNYSLNENWDQDNKLTTNSIALQCSSVNGIIEKQYSGRRTNDTDQQKLYPGDEAMSRVTTITKAQFQFGKPGGATV